MIQGNMRTYSNGRKKKYDAWSSTKKKPVDTGSSFVPNYSYTRGRTDHIPSHQSTAHNCAKVEVKEYTGTLIKGISTMHKSNAVPIISEQEAKEHASMRR